MLSNSTKTARLIPLVDSATAVTLTKADGSTVIATFDSVNGQLGVGCTPKTIVDINSGNLVGGFVNSTTGLNVQQNTYYDGAWKFTGTGHAMLTGQNQANGIWSLYMSTDAGVAGGAITWVNPLNALRSGFVGVGVQSPSTNLEVVGAAVAANTRGQLTVRDTTAITGSNKDMGGQLTFEGEFHTSFHGTGYTYAAISGRKQYVNNGHVGGYLTLSTSENPSGLVERMRITSEGLVGIGCTPLCSLDSIGTIRATGYSSPATGSGVEVFTVGATGCIVAYNRATSAHMVLDIDASVLNLNVGSGGKVVYSPPTTISVTSGYAYLLINVATGEIVRGTTL